MARVQARLGAANEERGCEMRTRGTAEEMSMSRRRFSTRTIMICAAIGVATGILLAPANVLSTALTVSFPLLVTPLYGLWAAPTLLALAVLRRPGVGILASTVCGLINVPVTPYGWTMVVQMLVWGALIEIPFLITRYRIWSMWIFQVAAALIGLISGFLLFFYAGGEQLAAPARVLAVALSVVGAMVVGALTVLVAKALARAGVGAARATVDPDSAGEMDSSVEVDSGVEGNSSIAGDPAVEGDRGR